MNLEELRSKCPVGTLVEYDAMDGRRVAKTACEVWEIGPGESVVRVEPYDTVVCMRSAKISEKGDS